MPFWLAVTNFENFPKGDDKLPFENDNYDMLETWNTICDLVKKGNVYRIQNWPVLHSQ